MQININSDLPPFFPYKVPPLHLIGIQCTSLFLKGRMKGPSFLGNQGREERPGPGLIHVAHTGGMLCMDNWLSEQHGHCWILMVLPKCHLTDVTPAQILKRLLSKASIWALSSPTVSGRDSTRLSGFPFQKRQILHSQPYLHRTVHPLSRSALNISNHGGTSPSSFKWKSKVCELWERKKKIIDVVEIQDKSMRL